MNGKWSGEMSYEQIGREEAVGVSPSGMRSDLEKRRSSWWGWGAGAGSATGIDGGSSGNMHGKAE